MTFACRTLRVCDIALRSAADSSENVTDDLNVQFHLEKAILVLSNHLERMEPL
jgi:hypothetical protein